MNPPLIADHPAPLTKQAAFDLAYRWALTHGYCYTIPKPAEPETKRCLYRSTDGDNACLMGCLIPDSVYKAAMDEVSISGADVIYETYPSVRALFADDVNGDFLRALQKVHDLGAFGGSYNRETITLDQYHANLRAFAEQHGLTVPTV